MCVVTLYSCPLRKVIHIHIYSLSCTNRHDNTRTGPEIQRIYTERVCWCSLVSKDTTHVCSKTLFVSSIPSNVRSPVYRNTTHMCRNTHALTKLIFETRAYIHANYIHVYIYVYTCILYTEIRHTYTLYMYTIYRNTYIPYTCILYTEIRPTCAETRRIHTETVRWCATCTWFETLG